MSIQVRRLIGNWLLMLLGIALITMQVIKYWNNTLELKIEELVVSFVAISLVLAPRIILESIEKFVNSKTNGKNES
jgi:hypothetical protein